MNPELQDRRANVALDLRGMDRRNREAEARVTKVDMICECGDVVHRDNWALHRNHEKVQLY